MIELGRDITTSAAAALLVEDINCRSICPGALCLQWLSESLSGEESQRVKSDRLVDDESRFYQLRTPFRSVEMHRHIETLMPESSFSDSS